MKEKHKSKAANSTIAQKRFSGYHWRLRRFPKIAHYLFLKTQFYPFAYNIILHGESEIHKSKIATATPENQSKSQIHKTMVQPQVPLLYENW